MIMIAKWYSGTLGPKASPHLSFTGEEKPRKTSPRKLVPTGDRTRARCVTGAHATAWPTVVDASVYKRNVSVELTVVSIWVSCPVLNLITKWIIIQCRPMFSVVQCLFIYESCVLTRPARQVQRRFQEMIRVVKSSRAYNPVTFRDVIQYVSGHTTPCDFYFWGKLKKIPFTSQTHTPWRK